MNENSLKVADLAKLSGISKSTIYYYLNNGVLHPPKRMGLDRAVYDWSHLSKLKRIHELRADRRLPLSTIKEMLSKGDFDLTTGEQESSLSLINALEEEKRSSRAQKSEKKRIEIMDAAIALFSKNGYEKTTLDAIAESLNIAKSTVYLYFKNKEKLFMDCIARLTIVAVPEEAWGEIRREENELEKLKKRGRAFHRAFPSYKGILTMTKASLAGDNKEMAAKAKNTLSLMTRPIAKDIRRGIGRGIFREMDEDIVSHLILGMGEGLGFRLMMDSRYTIEQGVEVMFDLVSHGLLKMGAAKYCSCSGKVTDFKGVTSMVEKMLFGKQTYLPVRMGDAEVSINLKTVKSIRFHGKGASWIAEINGKDEQKQSCTVDSTLLLSGEVRLGAFAIPLKSVSHVQFMDEK